MHRLAKRILKQVEPTLEKMLDEGISEKELYAAESQVRIAHDLIECDVMLHKMEEMEGSKAGATLVENPAQRRA